MKSGLNHKGKDAENMDLRADLNALKEKHGLTNQQISDASGVPLGTVSGIFSGQTARPAFQDIVAILTAMEESVDEFCGIAAPRPVAEECPAPPMVEHRLHSITFAPFKADTRELVKEAIEEVHASDAYKILDSHVRWWRTIAIILIALVVIWFTWDITHPDVGLIQYSSAQPAITSGMAVNQHIRV